MNASATAVSSRRFLAVIAITMVALIAAACSGGDDEPDPTSTSGTGPVPTSAATSTPRSTVAPTATAGPTVGSVDIRVTDQADETITVIVITATDLQVHAESAAADSWITVLDGEHTFDLLQVVGSEESLGIGELAAGTYTQIRMNVESVIITRGGADQEAIVPSSELKIVRPFEVVEGETTVLTFDFNANRSVVVSGPNLRLIPVVKLLVRKGGEPFVPEAPDPTATATLEPTPTPTPPPDEFVLQIVEPVELESFIDVPTMTLTGRTRIDAVITVDDLFVEPDLDGVFTVELTLEEGENIIEVVASISTGEELSTVLTVIYLPN